MKTAIKGSNQMVVTKGANLQSLNKILFKMKILYLIWKNTAKLDNRLFEKLVEIIVHILYVNS